MREVVNEPRKLVSILHKRNISEDIGDAKGIKLIKDFVHDLNDKERGSVLAKHFYFSGKRGYLVHQCKGSPYLAMRKNGIHLFPWEMSRAPKNFYGTERNRIDAIRWLFAIKKLTVIEFRTDFAYLLKYYGNSASRALKKSSFIALRNEGWEIKPLFNVTDWYRECRIRWQLH